MLLMFKIPIPQYIVDSLPHTIWLVLFHRIDLSLDVVLGISDFFSGELEAFHL